MNSFEQVAGHPRNDVMLNKTFLAVEQKEDDGSWTVIATDADWDTKWDIFNSENDIIDKRQL